MRNHCHPPRCISGAAGNRLGCTPHHTIFGLPCLHCLPQTQKLFAIVGWRLSHARFSLRTELHSSSTTSAAPKTPFRTYAKTRHRLNKTPPTTYSSLRHGDGIRLFRSHAPRIRGALIHRHGLSLFYYGQKPGDVGPVAWGCWDTRYRSFDWLANLGIIDWYTMSHEPGFRCIRGQLGC